MLPWSGWHLRCCRALVEVGIGDAGDHFALCDACGAQAVVHHGGRRTAETQPVVIDTEAQVEVRALGGGTEVVAEAEIGAVAPEAFLAFHCEAPSTLFLLVPIHPHHDSGWRGLIWSCTCSGIAGS